MIYAGDISENVNNPELELNKIEKQFYSRERYTILCTILGFILGICLTLFVSFLRNILFNNKPKLVNTLVKYYDSQHTKEEKINCLYLFSKKYMTDDLKKKNSNYFICDYIVRNKQLYLFNSILENSPDLSYLVESILNNMSPKALEELYKEVT